jgi:hypothetical protein
MIDQWYIIKDDDDKEVNFIDRSFPNSKNRAIQCAKQVEGSCVILRKRDKSSGETREEMVWPDER